MINSTIETIELITKKISADNNIISIKPNSIFAAIETDNSEANINDLATKTATAINNELILIKNKLKPFMEDIIRVIESKALEFADDSELSKYKITPYNLPAIIAELKDIGVIGKGREAMELGNINIIIPVPTKEEIRALFTHKSAAVNKYAEEILVTYTDEALIDIWEKYISSISPINPNIRNMGMLAEEKINDLILLAIILDKLSTYRPTGVNADEEAYYDAIKIYTNEVCNYISNVVKTFEVNRKVGKLILKIKDTEAIVDSEVYQKYLDEGGTPEAILGLIVSGTKETHKYLLEEIKGHTEEYIALWQNKVKLYNYNAQTIQANKYATIYSIVLPLVYEKLIPQDLKEILIVDYEQAKTMMTEILQNTPAINVPDIKTFARRLVGEVLFPNTNFNYFATNMMDYYKLNPNITSADAATFASLDFIIDFMLDQLYIGDINGSTTGKQA